VNGAARLTQDAPQSGVEPLRLRARGLDARRDEAGEPDAGVLDQGGGDLTGTHHGQNDTRVVPEQGDDLFRREGVPPLRGRHQGGKRARSGQSPIAGNVRLPWDGGRDRAGDPQLHRRHGATVAGGTGSSARGPRIGGSVLRTPRELAAGTAIAGLGTGKRLSWSTMAGGRIHTTVARNGGRPGVVTPYVGVASVPSPPAIVVVGAVGSGHAA